jgi:hypothetical protein
MRVRYEEVEGHLEPYYQCTEAAVRRAGKLCQSVRGRPIDEAISARLVESVAPAAIEVALAVQEEIAHRIEQAESFRRAQLERARYEAELARRRYLKVDPDNRLVADALEADWNDRLRQLDALQREHERPTRRRSGAAQRRGARTHSLARKRVPLHLERFAVRGAKGDGLRAGFSALPKGELLQCRHAWGCDFRCGRTRLARFRRRCRRAEDGVRLWELRRRPQRQKASRPRGFGCAGGSDQRTSEVDLRLFASDQAIRSSR